MRSLPLAASAISLVGPVGLREVPVADAGHSHAVGSVR